MRGEPCRSCCRTPTRRAYPHVRGGTRRSRGCGRRHSGLSRPLRRRAYPHARGGTNRGKRSGSLIKGLSPTCVGEPMPARPASCRTRAYPHVRGGTSVTLGIGAALAGLSPRAWGNLDDPAPVSVDPGPIPRAWGNLDRRERHLDSAGPIPTCVGEPIWTARPRSPRRAYPHVRGGTEVEHRLGSWRAGLSPRAWGNRWSRGWWPSRTGPIPTCVGEPTCRRATTAETRAYPHVRGGTSITPLGVAATQGLSPRAWGNLRTLALEDVQDGPIPTCVGEPPCSRASRSVTSTYPHVRGGTTAQ